MAKPTAQERRKQVLKQRRAEEQREADREEAQFLYQDAVAAQREGDAPAAARYLKKALILDPKHAGAVGLLSDIHRNAGHYGEALGYLRRLHELTDLPTVLYSIGAVYQKLGQTENMLGALGEFLEASKASKWERDLDMSALRAAAAAALATSRRPAEPSKAAPPAAKPAEKKRDEAPTRPPLAEPPKAPEPTPVHVQFFPPALPAFAHPGNLNDYFLRRQWTGLRLEQSFEDLLCLPSLEGVDAYMYQQETVRRVLRHFKGRALLADEVGLGKTIEACMVLKEYWMRGLVAKALVLTPPSLVAQWKGELSEKFGLQATSPDTADFRRGAPQFWSEGKLVVASIAQARLEPHASAIARMPWDMVIVDEAHCLKNRTSLNWQLVDSLQKKFILMLTATPVENNLVELYNLITLLKPGLLATEADFRKAYVTPGKPRTPKNAANLKAMLGDVMIRNTRAAADVQLPRRIAATVSVGPSELEDRVYNLVSHFVAERYRAAGGKPASTLALDLMQRQAGSSPQALSRSVARALREETWVKPGDRRELEAILDLACRVEHSSKGTKLGRMLSTHPGKAVVFTEFLPTLDHLAHVCDQHGISYSLFRGDQSRPEKEASIAKFRDHARVLLSTGAGGEGRNLQFADTVVNFDLPWNPMRIEQRVGRVHRIGQTHDVFVFNFCQEGTVEEHLLRVLHDKINMFELVVGEMDAILGAMDDSRDFAEIVMDLWIAGRESGEMERGFDRLATQLLEAKKQHVEVQELDESLFAQDFEV